MLNLSTHQKEKTIIMDTKKKLVQKIIQLQVDFFFNHGEMPNEIHIGGEIVSLIRQVEEEETRWRKQENTKPIRKILWGLFRFSTPYRAEEDFECRTIFEPSAPSAITITHFRGGRILKQTSHLLKDLM